MQTSPVSGSSLVLAKVTYVIPTAAHIPWAGSPKEEQLWAELPAVAAVLMNSLLLLPLFSASTPEFLLKIQSKLLEAIAPHPVTACSCKKFKLFIRRAKDFVPKMNVCHHDHKKPLKSLSYFFLCNSTLNLLLIPPLPYTSLLYPGTGQFYYMAAGEQKVPFSPFLAVKSLSCSPELSPPINRTGLHMFS